MRDLTVFLMFYGILVYMFSLIMGVIGFQNYTRLDWWEETEAAGGAEYYEVAGFEYYELHPTLANVCVVTRMSMGDNNFDWVAQVGHDMDAATAYMFWII